ncbi:MAG: ABC transporter transmembrane domain-containing protein [Defluviitaleaceae bacterium]|nr:ABC transporter transmembrane domain-containing protein [Defluviitaleaceae bacterium]
MREHIDIFKTKRKAFVVLAILSLLYSGVSLFSVFYSGFFIDELISSQVTAEVLRISIIFLIISLISIGLDYIVNLMLYPTSENIVFAFKQKAIKKLINNDKDVTYLSKRVDDDARQITMFFISNYVTFFLKVIEIIAIAIFVFKTDTIIALLMFVIVPIYFSVYHLFKKSIFNRNLQAREATANFYATFANRINPKIELNDDEFNNVFYTYLEAFKKRLLVDNNLKLSKGSVVALMQGIVFFVGGLAVLNGNTTIGMLSILMQYFNRIIANVSYYMNLGKQWQITKTAIQRFSEL